MKQKMLKGIDISEFNGNIDFKKLKNEVDFIYIRATYGRYGIDKRFYEYTSEAIKNEIPFGFYYYSYATDETKAEEEVYFFLSQIQQFKDFITYPLAIDMEDSDGYKVNNGNPDKDILTNICIKACEKIAEKSFTPIIYACDDWFKNHLDFEKLGTYLKWIAFWETKEENIDKSKYSIWQYSSKGKVNGINTNVDLNYSFVDFARLKEYIENISKINFIKSKTMINDLSIQYMSCYKWGNELLNKIYKALNSSDKLVYKELELDEMKKEVKKYIGLEQKTIDYLSVFLYEEDLFRLLYNAICGRTIEIKEN